MCVLMYSTTSVWNIPRSEKNIKSLGDRGSTVVKVLCYKSEGRWFDPRWCQSFRSHFGPGVDSASNRNECQEYFLGVKMAGA